MISVHHTLEVLSKFSINRKYILALIFYVSASPKVTALPPIGLVTVTEGDDATLECESSGNPLPALIWSRNEGLPENAVSTCSRSSCLYLSSVKRDAAGVYHCQADNGVGVPVKAQISLKVECKVDLNLFIAI